MNAAAAGSRPSAWRRLRARLLRAWIRGALGPAVCGSAIVGSAIPFAVAVRTDSKTVAFACLALLMLLAGTLLFGLVRLHRAIFTYPASASLIADMLAIETPEVRLRLVARHAEWRRHAPMDLLTPAMLDIWARMEAEALAEARRPILPAYNAAVAQDRGFLQSIQER